MIGSDYPYSEFLPQKTKVIQIDERGFAIGRRLPVTQPVVGSSRPAVASLIAGVAAKSDDSFLRKMQKEWADWQEMLTEKADPKRSKGHIHPQALARTVSDLASDNAVFCVDTGLVTLWTANWLTAPRHPTDYRLLQQRGCRHCAGHVQWRSGLGQAPPGYRDVW